MPHAAQTSLNRCRPKRCASSLSVCWMIIDWKTNRFSKSPSVIVHVRLTICALPFLVGPTVAFVVSALYLPRGISAIGGVPSSFSTSKAMSRVVDFSILLAPVLAEFGEVEVDRDRHLLRHAEPIFRCEGGSALEEQVAAVASRSAHTLAEPTVVADSAQVFGEEANEVAGVHYQGTSPLIELRCVAGECRRSRILDAHHFDVSDQDDRHVVLVTDRGDAADEAAPFIICCHPALAVGWLLDIRPVVLGARVFKNKRLERIEGIDNERLISTRI